MVGNQDALVHPFIRQTNLRLSSLTCPTSTEPLWDLMGSALSVPWTAPDCFYGGMEDSPIRCSFLSSALVWQLHAVQSDKREEAETCVASIIVCHAIIVNEVTVFAIGRDRTVVLTFLMSFACSGETNSKLSS